MGNSLSGKVALVTGASRGLGRAIAIKLGSLGTKVAVNYLSNDSAAEDVTRLITEHGGSAISLKANVADSVAVKEMVSRITVELGSIDILVNNAGITRDGLLPRLSENDWDSVINTNLRGAFLCTKFALRSMMNQPWGRIINIASLAGITGNMGQANYSASKGGLIAFTRATAREVAARNITANVVAPGFFVTDMTQELPRETKDFILSRIPLKRFGDPAELANLVAFLAGEESAYITAQVICIDGGVI